MRALSNGNNPIETFDDTLSPEERLRALVEKTSMAKDSQLGIGYHKTKSGNSELVFTDQESGEVITVPTAATRVQVERILEGILPLEETKFILIQLAKAYDQRTPIIFEGGTGIGKTFVVNTFAKLIYGPNAVVLDFYCNGQTDISELNGKYVPTGIKPEQQESIKRFLNTDAGKALKAEIIAETGGQYNYKELHTRAAQALGLPIDEKNFEFQLGVLPLAMTASYDQNGNLQYTADGPGVMLHIQEVGLAPPSVINALLKIRGQQGKLAEEIQVWEDGGRRVKTGPGAFIVLSTNPVGKGFQERFEIDRALARSLIWITLPDKLSDESILKAAREIFSFDRIPPQKNTLIDLSKNSELSEVLSTVMAKFHKIHDEMLDKGESGRRQKIPTTIDNLWLVAGVIQEVQIPKANLKGVDLIKSLQKAVEFIYLHSLQDKPSKFKGTADLRGASKDTLGGKILAAFDSVLGDPITSLIEFRGQKTTPKNAIEVLTAEMFAASESKEKQNVINQVRGNIIKKAELQTLIVQLLELKNSNQPGTDGIIKASLSRLSPEDRRRVLDHLDRK